MPFRDDRDAQLARLDALERENRALREALAEREEELAAATAGEGDRSRENRRLRRELERKERRERRLREELERERGPGLASRIGSRIAALRLPEPSGDGGFWRAALGTWRLYLPVALGLAIPVASFGGTIRIALLAALAATPAVAALLAMIFWLLNRRTRGTAGGACAFAVGVLASAGSLLPTAILMERHHFELALLWPGVLAIYTMALLIHVTRGVEPGDLPLATLPFVWLLTMPLPHILFVPTAFTVWGAKLGGRRER